MRVRILPSATDGSDQQYLTTFLLNGNVALDAGCLGLYGGPPDQASIGDVVLTHSHADHVCSLATFAMNVMDYGGRSTRVWSHAAVLASLRDDLFNGRVWPDFLSPVAGREPIVALEEIRPRQPFLIQDLRFTAIPVNHPVETMGYVIEDECSAIVICTDSGPTDELWEAARSFDKLTTIFVGVAFPDSWQKMAAVAGHLTPRLLREQIAGLDPRVRVVAVHIKPAHRSEIIEQLHALEMPALSIGRARIDYDCSTREAAPPGVPA